MDPRLRGDDAFVILLYNLSMPRIHATSVVFCGRGVLLQGEPGTGKSDLALRLIDAGGLLIADDYTDIEMEGGRLIARTPETIQGLLELRHVGIVKMASTPEAEINIVVHCAMQRPERLPPMQTILLHGVQLPLYTLMAHEASAVAKIRAILQNQIIHD